MDDSAIIELYNRRSESAIRETDLKYGRLLNHVSDNIVHNAQEAEECVSDTYLSTWNAIPPEKPDNFRAFLLRIVRNISINKLTRAHRKKRGGGEYRSALEEMEEAVPDPRSGGNMADEIALRDTINRFLEGLSQEQRAIFIGRYWYFDSVNDIARNLGKGVSMVKMTLLRCRERLRDTLEKEGYSI